MITDFRDRTTQDIYDGTNSKAARKIPKPVQRVARRKLDMLNAARTVQDLSAPPGNRLEALKGHLRGRHSIRINDQYRLVFKFENGSASSVWITDYHS
ncbi:MAG: type II toxin-antitoxin system RelE/ParE family toxin [Nitrospirae bacterium]|nr:type II toxin-antitoxin system RelE/ParE family toxin [Nitrospirota bacterium]